MALVVTGVPLRVDATPNGGADSCSLGECLSASIVTIITEGTWLLGIFRMVQNGISLGEFLLDQVGQCAKGRETVTADLIVRDIDAEMLL